MRYKVGKLTSPVHMNSGDTVSLNLSEALDDFGLERKETVLHKETVNSTKRYTHWAFCDFGDNIDAIFMGSEKLEEFILEKFPGIVQVNANEDLFV